MAPFQRAHDVDVARRTLRGVASAHCLELGGAHELVAHQIGQFQVIEQQVEEFLARQLEDEVVLTLAAPGPPCPAGAAAEPSSGAAPDLRPRTPCCRDGSCLYAAAGAIMEHRLGDVFRRDTDLFAAIDVGDAAPIDGVRHRALEL
jgi:hypothetical protein